VPSYDKAVLGRQASELGFIRDTYEKVIRLADVLAFINSDPLLQDSLALKGGTAINLTIFDLPRLSVDIDLDHTRNNSRVKMLADRQRIDEVVARHMAASGYRPARARKHHSLDATVWAYASSAGVNDNIKVEINYSLRAHILPAERRPLRVLGSGEVVTLAPIEVYASKIVALLTRGAARDLYDIDNMVTHNLFAGPDAAALLRRCVVFYLAVSTETVPDPDDRSAITGLTERKIRTDLRPVLRKRDRFDLPAAQQRVTGYLNGLLRLTDSEQEFLAAFRAHAWKPELVSGGEELARIAHHPMAAWKLAEHA
jgi:predicted nucleotidyltransferase component of viral defense system